jgi:Fe-S-cluster containining protein
MTDGLKEAVKAAAQRTDVAAAVGEVYAQVQAEIDQRKPRCERSGRCCRFEEYGHRLYVTTIELAAFVAREGEAPAEPDHDSPVGRLGRSLALPLAETRAWDGTGCPFQQARLCTVHPIRPFGCRIFFCDPTSTDSQNDAYEHFHARIKALHESLNVPYFYVEWRRALAELGLAAPVSGGRTSF